MDKGHRTRTLPKEGLTLVETKCAVCSKCWLVINPRGPNYCIYGGPFTGYYKRVDDDGRAEHPPLVPIGGRSDD
jgi:hypothetical protein